MIRWIITKVVQEGRQQVVMKRVECLHHSLECLGYLLHLGDIIHCKAGMSFAHPYFTSRETRGAMPEP